jgi:hypothetical protein
MVQKYLEATGTKDYLTESEITEIIVSEKVQGRIMTAVIRRIGMKICDAELSMSGAGGEK